GGGAAAGGEVIGDAGRKGFLQFANRRAGRVGDATAGDCAHRENAAVGRRDEDFVGGVEVLGQENLFFDGHAGVLADFEKDRARDAFEAAGGKRWSEDASAAGAENIGRGTFGDFAALVQEHRFVEAVLLRFVKVPDVVEPGGDFD